jgi:5-methylcytosine-specific restriction endonuclease McrA
MSPLDPGAPTPLAAIPRQRLSAEDRAQILKRQQHCCGGPCGKSLVWQVVDDKPVYGPMVDEHLLPLALGGTNDLSNRALLCVPCANDKTRADRKVIAKVARIRRRLTGDVRPKRKIRSRGFPRDPWHWRNAE